MASSGLQQAAKVLGAAGLFGVTSLIGSPIAGAVVTGVGGPILDMVTREGIDYALEKWRSEKTELNHDLQMAMQSAFANATARLETQWWETEHAKRLTKARRTPAETFFDTFKRNIAWAFSDDEFSSLTAHIQAFKTDATARTDFQNVIDEQLRTYLHGHDDDALFEFMRRRLVAEAALCFTEVLKTNDRAWRAWQLLLNEGVQAGLNESLRKQDQLVADVAKLKSLLEELREQANELRRTPPAQRDPWGEAALLSVHDSLAKQIEEEAERTRETVREEGEHTRGTVRDEGEQTRATVVEGNAEIKEGIRGLELTLTTLIKRDAPAIAGGLLQPAPDHHRRIWNVPHSRNPNFTGRDAWLDILATATGPAGTPLAHAIIGMGGVGKSQLAAEFAYRSSNHFPIVWWIRAEEPATLVGDLAALATELGLPIAATGKAEEVAAAARIWLEQTDQRWLLIFDNAELSRDLAPHLPRLGNGRVLITSRLHVWNGLASPLDLDVLEPKDAVRFLLHRTGQTDGHGASAIVQQVDGLPLALEQAAAYIVEHGTSFARYLELFQVSASRLLGEQHATANTNAAVTTTWLVSIRAVSERSPAAVDLLNLCACFAPDLIPIEVIRTQTAELPERLATALTDPLTATETVGVLYRYSLIDVIDDNTISMHRLVQFAVTDSMPAEEQSAWSGAAVRLLRRSYPFDWNDPNTWRESERLMPHALAACDAADSAHTAESDVSGLLDRVALFLQVQGQFIRARDLFERILEINITTYGSDHSESAEARINLGIVLQDLGNLATSKSVLEEGLHQTIAIYGIMHPKVADARIFLGFVLSDIGDSTGAKWQYQQALRINLAKYGFNHPQVARVRSILGGTLKVRGDLAGARWQFDQALKIDLATYGPDHPLVIRDYRQLNDLLGDSDQLANVQHKLEQSLKSDRSTYGSNHPKIAEDHRELGSVLKALGDLAGARSQFERALESDLATYGPNHPDVAGDHRNLGVVLRTLGTMAEAKIQFERALEIDLASHGPSHPAICFDYELLGSAIEALGDLASARTLFEKSLEVGLAIYGPKYIRIATLHMDLGLVNERLSNYRDARGHYEQAFAIFQELGDERAAMLARDSFQALDASS